MEQMFSNLYRVSSPNRRGTSHTYFLKRKESNLLVCHQARPSPEDLDEIESLGGIESQWVCHNHDLVRDGLHQDLFDRFGCSLHYHGTDRKRVRTRTKCPDVEFGDDGDQHRTDFEAFYLPTCSPGHSVYRWRNRGKYYLITSHSMYQQEGEWDLCFNQKLSDKWGPQLGALSKLRVDYLFPGYTGLEDEDFYRLSDQSRKSLSNAIRDKQKAAA